MEKKSVYQNILQVLIVVAVIAIIAAIAVPSMLKARMVSNESGAIQGCRTIGSAEVAYATLNGGKYTSLLEELIAKKYLDPRFSEGLNGYRYDLVLAGDNEFSVVASPINNNSSGRFKYSIGTDQVVRYMGKVEGVIYDAKCGIADCQAGDPVTLTTGE